MSDASAVAVLRFFSEHRDGILVAVVLNGVAWCALLPAVFAGLRSLLGAGGGSAATVALVAAGVESVQIGVALLFGALAAYAAPSLTPASAKLLSGGFEVATSASAWPTLPCVIGLVVAVRRSGLLPGSVVVVGVLVAALHAISAVSFARAGLFSPTGIALAAAPAFAIWMAVTAVGLLRRSVRARLATPVAA